MSFPSALPSPTMGTEFSIILISVTVPGISGPAAGPRARYGVVGGGLIELQIAGVCLEIPTQSVEQDPAMASHQRESVVPPDRINLSNCRSVRAQLDYAVRRSTTADLTVLRARR